MRKRVPTGLFAIAFVACLAYYLLRGQANVALCRKLGRSRERAVELTIAQTEWLTKPYNETLRAMLSAQEQGSEPDPGV